MGGGGGLGILEGFGDQKLYTPLLPILQVACVAHSLKPLNAIPPCPVCGLIVDEDVGQNPLHEIWEGHPKYSGVKSPVAMCNRISSVWALLLHMIRSQSNNWSLCGGGGGRSPRVVRLLVPLPGLPKPLPHHPLSPPP